MSIAPLDPPGIDAAGNAKIWFVPAIADTSKPTVAEIEAGVDLSCALYTFVPTLEQPTNPRSKYCYKQPAQSLGRPNYGIEAIEYDYAPQDPDNADYAYYAELETNLHGFVVERRGLDARVEEIEADELVDIYPVQLGARGRVAIDPTSTDNQKLRTRQIVAVTGDVKLDVVVVAAAD